MTPPEVFTVAPIEVVKARIAEISPRLRELADKNSLTRAEETEFESLREEFEQLAARKKDLEERYERAGRAAGLSFGPPVTGSSRDGNEHRGAALRSIERAWMVPDS